MTDPTFTHIMLIADRSGSMHGIAGDMNGAILGFMEDQAKEDGTCTVDVITFDDKIDVLYENQAPDKVLGDVIQPRGSTALLDAIGFGITRLGRKLSVLPEEKRPGLVIVAVVTDGYENASKEYTYDQIKAMVEEQTNTWKWEFVYLAANVDAFGTGAAMGFAPGSTMGYAAASAGVGNTYGSLSKNASVSRGRVAKGQSANLTFSDEDRDAAMEE